MVKQKTTCKEKRDEKFDKLSFEQKERIITKEFNDTISKLSLLL